MENNNIELINEPINVAKYELENIKKLIYTIRGKQVMLDSDVAMLYNYETKDINKAMKKNKERFPEDFCFELSFEELRKILIYLPQNEQSKCINYAYTEQGIAMLAGILRNEIVVQVSITILRTFVEMRKFKFQKDSYFKI